jgi:hypothetical protein
LAPDLAVSTYSAAISTGVATFDYIRKIDESTFGILISAPLNVKSLGLSFFLILEHLSNPELGIQNIANHIETGGFIAITPKPLTSKQVLNAV